PSTRARSSTSLTALIRPTNSKERFTPFSLTTCTPTDGGGAGTAACGWLAKLRNANQPMAATTATATARTTTTGRFFGAGTGESVEMAPPLSGPPGPTAQHLRAVWPEENSYLPQAADADIRARRKPWARPCSTRSGIATSSPIWVTASCCYTSTDCCCTTC